MMLNANNPEFSARYPYGAIFRDRWGRRIPGVIACDPETGEVISYDGTWLTGEWLWLTRRLRIGVVTRHWYRWASPSGSLLRRHGFWPAPLTVEGKTWADVGHVRCRCSSIPLAENRPAHVATIRERIATATDGPGLTLAQLDDLMVAVEPPTP
jgi:hypothetical protein